MPTVRMTGAIATVLILAACAATNTDVKPPATTLAKAQNSACLSQTGSRIPNSSGSCAAFGRSYSSDDINRTGSTTTDGALRLLDPSIAVHQ
jgi:hypothetical protein